MNYERAACRTVFPETVNRLFLTNEINDQQTFSASTLKNVWKKKLSPQVHAADIEICSLCFRSPLSAAHLDPIHSQ